MAPRCSCVEYGMRVLGRGCGGSVGRGRGAASLELGAGTVFLPQPWLLAAPRPTLLFPHAEWGVLSPPGECDRPLPTHVHKLIFK